MAGTLFTPTDVADRARGAFVKAVLLRGAAFKTTTTNKATGKLRTIEGTEYESLVYKVCKGSPAQVRAFAGAIMKGGGGRL